MNITNKKFEFFCTANSYCGFINNFHQFFKYDKTAKCYIIKAGPGCGKSTMMRGIADYLQKKDFEVLLFPCTSDPNSLDGVYCKDINFMIVDGTAPHIIEPNYPMFFENIINLYDCIDREKIKNNSDNLLNDFSKNSVYHKRSKNILNAIKEINDDSKILTETYIDKEKLENFSNRLVNKLFKTKLNKKSICTNLFLSGITLNGLQYFSKTPVNMVKNIYAIHDIYGNCSNYILNKIYEKATQSGYNVIKCHCPISPYEKIDHLIIKELDIAFITVNKYLKIDYIPTKNIHFSRFLKTKIPQVHKNRIKFNNKTILNLTKKLQEQLLIAKKYHDNIENCYVSAVDFSKIDIIKGNIINDIEKTLK